MEENKDLVIEQIAENVEHTTEETPKMYTQAEVDAIVGKSKARAKAQAKKEFDRKYGKLEEVLRAGTGKESVEEITDTFTKFYGSKGIKLPEKPVYTDSITITILNASMGNKYSDTCISEIELH